jgi:hypothetical protein
LTQNVVDFGTTLQKINVMKSVFNPPSVSTLSGKCLIFFVHSVQTYEKFQMQACCCCLWSESAELINSLSMINSLVHLLSFMIWICRTDATFFEETFLCDKQSNFTVSSILLSWLLMYLLYLLCWCLLHGCYNL